MEIRKRACKLFKDIETFISENSLKTDAASFLMNRLQLFEIGKRSSAGTLRNIGKKDFGNINKKFRDRLPLEMLKYLSVSRIITLPEESVIEIENFDFINKKILFLSNRISVSRELEKNNFLCFSNSSKEIKNFFSENISFSPVERNQNIEVSSQATIFELINNTQSILRPDFFDFIIDEIVYSEPLNENFISNITHLLKESGKKILITKNNFYISSATKSVKNSLFSSFYVTEIKETPEYLTTELIRKTEPAPDFSVIKQKDSIPMIFRQEELTFNNLFTFDITIEQEIYALIKKIETASENKTASDYFRFFIGMFPLGTKKPELMTLRLNSKFKHFIKGREIDAFQKPNPKFWIMPDPSKFSQMPKTENMERDKLLIRYLSSKPVFTIDRTQIYFLNDTAAIIPKDKNISLEYAEAYFNSSLIEFYYTLRFPQNNKFLKKNFQKIPFIPAGTTIQNIITDAVEKFKAEETGMSIFDYNQKSEEKSKPAQRKRIDRFIYQLFSLNQHEVNLIENYLLEKKN